MCPYTAGGVPPFLRDPARRLPVVQKEFLALTTEDIINFALHMVETKWPDPRPYTHGRLVDTFAGLAHIGFVIELETLDLEAIKFVIWVPMGWRYDGVFPSWSATQESHIETLSVLRERTTIPVPEVICHDLTYRNQLGMPYICMTFLPGRPVSEVWFEDPSGPGSREEMRLKILTNVANAMAQLSSMVFNLIGTLRPGPRPGTHHDGVFYIGETFALELDRDRVSVYDSRTYVSSDTYLRSGVALDEGLNEYDKGVEQVMKTIMCYMPANGGCGFALCHPHLDARNVLVDDDGNVTGVTNWEFAQTMPRFLGYCKYPAWIMRDWDPLSYGWPVVADEDSPEALVRYRAHYNAEMGKALGWEGDWRFTQKSHMYEAFWVASRFCWHYTLICIKFIQAVMSCGYDEALGIVYRIGAGEYEENDWEQLEAKLKNLMR